MPDVKLRVKLADLGLDPLAQQRLIYMTGCRYKPNKKELVLTCEKFPSRIENKTYVTHQLEQLMQVASQPDPEFDESYARDQADRAARKLLRYRH
ncbi:hypothetical protein CTAYLR_006666 [Chrysophaeum taylorii]|uniref:Small ribosomal subunit protein mS35 mitochondrial conserved domain-containing protein n=1 Tax=Chrysophaeum taylorii TaxID=2483200 RepID=A0AAD7UEW3_9STRA|nr:hypothetical protein CTAYLR_006666 [Chrysophaeum taylorii]